MGVVALAAWSALAAGCGAGSGAGAVLTARVDTVAGTERWLYPGTGATALGWAVDTVAVIGGAEVDDDAYQFNNVTPGGMTGDGAGRLYLLDRTGTRILSYDSLGHHLGTLGRAGNGPGELAMPLTLALGPGDSIWVSDVGARRYMVYPQDGGEARSVAFPSGFVISGQTLAVRGGGVIQDFQALRLPGITDAAPGIPPGRPIHRMSADGATVDTLWLSVPPKTDDQQSGSGGRQTMIRMMRTFEPQLAWGALADGTIVVSDTADYVLRLISPSGSVIRQIERDLPARATTEADKEAARERARKQAQGGGGGGVRIAFSIGGSGGGNHPAPPPVAFSTENMTFAPRIPRITGVRIDRRDRIWVGVSLEKAGETERIDLYDRDGKLLGELKGHALPAAFFGPSLAATLVRDEMEVQQVVVTRLREGQ
jgi:hypothetical protein